MSGERSARRCQHCGQVIAQARTDARYCSPACRTAAWRTRREGGTPAFPWALLGAQRRHTGVTPKRRRP
jgi:hypothetical protein